MEKIIIDKNFINFLSKAKKSTYANSTIENFDGVELHCSGGIII